MTTTHGLVRPNTHMGQITGYGGMIGVTAGDRTGDTDSWIEMFAATDDEDNRDKDLRTDMDEDTDDKDKDNRSGQNKDNQGESVQDFQCKVCGPEGFSEDFSSSNAAEEEDQEAVKAKGALNPEQPSKREVEEHELTHVLFRNWCVHCQRGKAANTGHRRSKEEDEDRHGHPIISIDYMYMEADYRDKGKEAYAKAVEGKSPILVMCDSRSRAVFAHDVGQKGGPGSTIERIEENLKNLGYASIPIVIKGDQEPSIVAMQDQVAQGRRQGATIVENSPVGESSANGHVERSIRSVQGQLRTIKDNVEAKMGRKIRRDSNIFRWMIEWAAATLTRYRINSNGKTSYAMIKGRQPKTAIAGFGEKVLYMPMKGSKIDKSKLEPQLEYGIFVGINMRTEETIIETKEGTVKAWTMKRLTPEDRWDWEFMDAVRGEPNQPVPGIPGRHIPIRIQSDGKPTSKEDEEADDDEAKEGEEVKIELATNKPKTEVRVRKMQVRKKDIQKYGSTPQCQGCRAVREELGGHVAHSEECRKRVIKEMEKDEVGKARLAKDKERVERGNERILYEESMKDPVIRAEEKDIRKN